MFGGRPVRWDISAARSHPGQRIQPATLVVRTLIVGSSKESMHRCGGVTAAPILSVTLRPFVVGSLFLLLFSLTLGVGVLILCDRRLRMKFKGFIYNRTQHLFGSA